MQCNIDARGKAVRLVSGVVVSVIGVVLVVLAALGTFSGVWAWVLAGVTLASGVFQIYEGWCGWCVVRAMGFKTPI